MEEEKIQPDPAQKLRPEAITNIIPVIQNKRCNNGFCGDKYEFIPGVLCSRELNHPFKYLGRYFEVIRPNTFKE